MEVDDISGALLRRSSDVRPQGQRWQHAEANGHEDHNIPSTHVTCDEQRPCRVRRGGESVRAAGDVLGVPNPKACPASTCSNQEESRGCLPSLDRTSLPLEG